MLFLRKTYGQNEILLTTHKHLKDISIKVIPKEDRLLTARRNHTRNHTQHIFTSVYHFYLANDTKLFILCLALSVGADLFFPKLWNIWWGSNIFHSFRFSYQKRKNFLLSYHNNRMQNAHEAISRVAIFFYFFFAKCSWKTLKFHFYYIFFFFIVPFRGFHLNILFSNEKKDYVLCMLQVFNFTQICYLIKIWGNTERSLSLSLWFFIRNSPITFYGPLSTKSNWSNGKKRTFPLERKKKHPSKY